MEMVEDVVIIGAGIAGLATAVALKRVGIHALVLERFDGLRATGAALTLFPNAWLALNALGVSHSLSTSYAPCKIKGVGPRSVHRNKLLQALADELPKGRIQFSSKLAKIETYQAQEAGSTNNMVTLRMEDGTIIKTKLLIGCDGVHSVVARWLGLAAPVHSGRSAARGLALFPQGHGLDQSVNQLKDVGKRAGFIPINDKEVYWYFICESPPQGEEMAGNPEQIQRKVIEIYAKNFPQEYLDIVRHSDLSTLTWAPLMFRYPLDIVFGNLSKGNITVVGDAMHPMTPDLGQGGCAALEDAVVLGRHIGNLLIANGRLEPIRDVALAIEGYVLERRWRVGWLVMGSYSLGWVQQSEKKWWMKYFFRHVIFIFRSVFFIRVSQYNCGILPGVFCKTDEADNSMKMD
ncbi:hypothetical protein LWI29_022483 [Acer saccharum]|uniref:FAD-binding domain-containing protein n=1 Tax=Acer saccharum TaxID=4024 RepID=A0AA39TUN0_ACESA|nr:hypothetical protein LWI29_022483 [Acer saccharum]